jgi:Zn-dependent protease with chaperone function
MADLLLGISSSRDIEKTAAQNKPADKSTLAILLSSHPETRQRAEQLKAGQTTGCPKKV